MLEKAFECKIMKSIKRMAKRKYPQYLITLPVEYGRKLEERGIDTVVLILSKEYYNLFRVEATQIGE